MSQALLARRELLALRAQLESQVLLALPVLAILFSRCYFQSQVLRHNLSF